MKPTSLVIAIGVLTAAGSGFFWQSARLSQVESLNQELRRQNAELPQLRQHLEQLRKVETDQADLTRLRKAEADRQQEVVRLRGQLGALLRAQAAADAPAPSQLTRLAAHSSTTGGPEDSASATLAGGSTWLQAATDQQLEAQLVRARERLQLNTDQEQTMREQVQQALAEGREHLQNVLSGKTRYDEVPTPLEWAKALEQQILAVLTPEQQAAYQKYKQEDLQASARLVANGELLQTQSSLGLSQEQQDQMFAVLYHQALNQMDPSPETMTARPRDPLAAAAWQNTQTLKHLETILTPQQLDTYHKMQEARVQYLKDLFAKSASMTKAHR